MAQTQKTDPYDRLDEEYAPSLGKMQAGDRFSGEILRIDRRDGGYGPYPILTLKIARASLASIAHDADPPVVASWHVLHSVAQSELARHRVKLGETVAVEYLGQKNSKTGTGRYHAWRVVVDRDDQPFNWSEFGDDHDIEPDIPTNVDNQDDVVPF